MASVFVGPVTHFKLLRCCPKFLIECQCLSDKAVVFRDTMDTVACAVASCTLFTVRRVRIISAFQFAIRILTPQCEIAEQLHRPPNLEFLGRCDVITASWSIALAVKRNVTSTFRKPHN